MATIKFKQNCQTPAFFKAFFFTIKQGYISNGKYCEGGGMALGLKINNKDLWRIKEKEGMEKGEICF